jgi:hypothetical protein
MKRFTKNEIRKFLFGVLTGFIIWFILDLFFNWDENVRDFWDGFHSAKSRFENTK